VPCWGLCLWGKVGDSGGAWVWVCWGIRASTHPVTSRAHQCAQCGPAGLGAQCGPRPYTQCACLSRRPYTHASSVVIMAEPNPPVYHTAGATLVTTLAMWVLWRVDLIDNHSHLACGPSWQAGRLGGMVALLLGGPFFESVHPFRVPRRRAGRGPHKPQVCITHRFCAKTRFLNFFLQKYNKHRVNPNTHLSTCLEIC